MADRSKKEKEKESPTPSPPRHNLQLPDTLKWGSKKTLRFVPPQPTISSAPRGGRGGGNSGSNNAYRRPRSSVGSLEPTNKIQIRFGASSRTSRVGVDGSNGGSGNIEVKKNLMTGLHVKADHTLNGNETKKMTGLHVKTDHTLNGNETKKAFEEHSNASMPWNLRRGGSSRDGGDARLSPIRRFVEEAPRVEGSSNRGLKWPKLSTTLTKEEIEADFLAMTGAKPPKRPQKRPKVIQKQINRLLPGSWLKDVNPNAYEVSDKGDKGKGEKGKGKKV